MATVKTRIGLQDHGRAMTNEEFLEAEEDPRYLYELARGVIEVSEIPSDWHAQVADNLHDALSEYRRRNPGLILRIPGDGNVRILVPELVSDRHPDLAVIFRDAPLDVRDHRIPVLAVEVVSPGKAARVRDYETKREEYLAYGLGEYWIVDPAERAVIVLVRAEGPSWLERRFEWDATIESDVLSELDVVVSQLWIDVEFDDQGSETR